MNIAEIPLECRRKAAESIAQGTSYVWSPRPNQPEPVEATPQEVETWRSWAGQCVVSHVDAVRSTNPTIADMALPDLIEVVRGSGDAGQRVRDAVHRVRTAIADGDQERADREKRSLPAVALSCILRDRKTPTAHTGLLQVDLDKLPTDKLSAIWTQAQADPVVVCGFLSPSGSGIKLAVRIPADLTRHQESFVAAARYFREKYGCDLDQKTKDVNRLCFLSHDAEAFLRTDPEELAIEDWQALPDPQEIAIAEDFSHTANDAGRAGRFVARFGEDIRFVPERGQWLTWASDRWTPDTDGAMVRLAMQLSREMLADSAAIGGTDDTSAKARSVAAKEAIAIGDRRNIENMLKLAQVDRKILLPVASLDGDPWLVGAQNAVVDLRTGTVREYGRTDYITRRLGCNLDPQAKCPRWDLFMQEVLPDADVRRFVWKAAGYSISGSMQEQVFFFLFGCGRNGKSIFTQTIEHVLGDLAGTAGKALLAVDPHKAHPKRELAAIAGLRLLLGTEVGDSEKLNEEIIKTITGGDSVEGAHLYQNSFKFRPLCKIWISGNHRPDITGTDDGIWRRVRPVPFLEKFDGDKADRGLADKLRSEASGILNWLVQGCLLWRKEGLAMPPAIAGTLAEYRSDQDVLGGFIDSAVIEDQQARLKHADLFEKYLEWSRAENIRFTVTSKKLAKRLRERGWLSDRATGQTLWTGYRLT
ncbi:MAG: phage/plasmid primase, P4 family [Verrucomicrobia bacterium]|nr:phage/plasmid primase, P4 family [Verrucomicrobiota bacterium]